MTSNLGHVIAHALRRLVRAPAFTLTALATVALTVGANTAIFSVVRGVLLRPLPFADADRLVRIWEANPGMNLAFFSVSLPNFEDWRAQGRSFERLSAFRRSRRNMTGTSEPEAVETAAVRADFFDVLGVVAAWGRTFGAGDDAAGAPPTTVLGHGLWQRRFGGDPGVVGRTLALDGQPHTVVGVLPPDFEFGPVEMWTPLVPSSDLSNRRQHVLGVIARLAPQATLAAARTDLATVARRLAAQFPDSNRGWSVRIERLEDWIIDEDVRRALLLLLGAVGFVLLIACANLAGLQLARTARRQRELAIRTALGAGRWDLIVPLLAESVLLGLGGGILGLAVASWGVDALRWLGPANLPRLSTVRLDASVLAFNLAASLLTGLLFGLAPALHAAGSGTVALGQDGRTIAPAVGRRPLRRVLVVGEIALSLVLLVGAGLLLRSVLALQRVPLGFAPEGLVTAQLNPAASRYADEPRRAALYAEIERRVRALPGVDLAALTNIVPFGGGNSGIDVTPEGGTGDVTAPAVAADWRAVTPAYFATLRVPVQRGRVLADTDAAGDGCVVVASASLAEALWPGRDPVGRRVRAGGANQPWCAVVGVVGNVRAVELDTEPRPALYIPAARFPQGSMTLVVRSNVEPGALVASVRRAVAEVDAELPLSNVRTMDEILFRTAAQPRFSAALLGLLAVCAVFLASLGLYGLLAQWVGERTREFGVRLAVGARPGDVLALVIGQGTRLGLAGLAVGLPAAAAASRLMSGLLYGVRPADPATYAAVSVLLALVAVLACWLPARRASRLDPTVALRAD
jgi:putative ABC transport system permease protein